MKDKDEEDTSLEDEVRAAFTDANAKSDATDNGDVIDALEEPNDKKPKDEADKKPKDEADKEEDDEDEADKEEDDEAKTDKEEGRAPVNLDNKKAPASWSPEVREQWGKLPEQVRAEIIRREEASANGVRRLHEEYAPIKRFTESLAPFIQEANSNGIDPSQYISNVMASERGLRNPDPKQRFAVLLNIAEQYGIPLRNIINESAGTEVIPAQQQPTTDPRIQQELQQIREFQQNQQQEALRNEIERFKSDKEFFDDVSDIMANLIDSNTAKDLQDAYDQACWINPEVRKVLISRSNSDKKTEDLKKRQSAASGATVKASGAAELTVDDDDDDSIEAAVRKSITEAGGRI